MLKPRHDLIGVQAAGMTPRRAMILGTVAMLHVIAVYALINGMAATIIKRIGPDIVVIKVDPEPPPKVIPTPPQPTIVRPNTAIPTTPPMPHIDIQLPATDDKTGPTLTHDGPTTPGKPLQVADTGPAGIMSTHTTPPYPSLARRLGQQGTVHLQMTISALGEVTAATVMESSGSSELDQAAIAWVLAHWKYKPALQGGAAMSGQTQAAIRFDLKQARD